MWPTSSEQLIACQRELAAATPEPWRPDARAPQPSRPGPGALAIGACVVCFARGVSGAGAAGDRAWAAAAVLDARRVIASATVVGTAGAPYAAGLLALREGPCLQAAVDALAVRPDVLLVDATGRDHPRRAGLAVHLGAVLNLPTVGVTHRPLMAVGEWPEDRRGATSPLLLDGAPVGIWLRTRVGARPLAVHAGWRTDIETAAEIVDGAAGAHRTPEALRHARMLARMLRAGRPIIPVPEP